MSISEFYPFKTRPDSIRLELAPAQEEIHRSSDGSLLVYETDSDRLVVNAVVSVPEDIISDVLESSEQQQPPVKAILTYGSIESRQRNSIILPGSGSSECSLEFSRDQWRGTVEVQASLVRTTENPNISTAYGSKAGARLAWSNPSRILFDEPRLPPGDYLRIVWKDFANSEDWLRRQSDHLFALDTSEEIPTLVLNQGISGAYKVLNSRSNSGKIAEIRDATFYMIVHQVWTSLIAEALVNLAEAITGDENNTDLILDELPVWQRRIVIDWAPKLYSEENADESLSHLISSIGQGNWSRDLLYTGLPEAIQRQYKTWRGFKGLVQEMGT